MVKLVKVSAVTSVTVSFRQDIAPHGWNAGVLAGWPGCVSLPVRRTRDIRGRQRSVRYAAFRLASPRTSRLHNARPMTDYPLEPDASEMHQLVDAAMRRIVAHIE